MQIATHLSRLGDLGYICRLSRRDIMVLLMQLAQSAVLLIPSAARSGTGVNLSFHLL
jgi:hypothetical protein